jgi:hypothetical protein
MSIRVRRGTRAAINAARTAGQLLFGELFIGTDDSKPGIAVAGNAYREIPLLGADGKLPALDGSNLTNLPIPELVGVGINQTWQAVTRAVGTSYQNVTGKPIVVTARISATNAGYYSVRVEVSDDNATWQVAAAEYYGGPGATYASAATAIIPNGAYYRIMTAGSSITMNALELR